MNREIKFRAKRIDNNELVYGYYVKDQQGRHRIYSTSNTYHFVNPETIGQFTGFLDKENKEIYEGDKVVYTLNHDSSQKEIEAEVEWHKHSWRLNRIWLLTEIRKIKVVGDVF